jgi:RNA polymerase sigma-70 factor (ECF subfamily)
MAVTPERVGAAGWSEGPVRVDSYTTSAPALVPHHDFHAIYDAWFDEVSRWVRAMGGPDADRDDLVQDVFVVVHRRLHAFDGENLPGWLYRIAAHRVRDFLRLRWVQNFMRRGAQLSDMSDRLPSGAPTPAALLEDKEKRVLIDRLLSKLGAPQRAAFVLFEIEGYSGDEIARIQGVPLNTVWARIQRARKTLKGHLARSDYGHGGTAA